MCKQVVVSGAFDNLLSGDLRFLEAASRLGELTVLLWPDQPAQDSRSGPANFPQAERLYLLKAVRYVTRVVPLQNPASLDSLPPVKGLRPHLWVDRGSASEARREYCRAKGLDYQVLAPGTTTAFLDPPPPTSCGNAKKVVVTGCYDWFHSGHVRFFEEVSTYGDLYVIVGNDANVRRLKGGGHPLFSQEERRFVVGSIRFVKQALISSGDGWLDADPEIQSLKPDLYAVNEDGDKGGKREYCQAHGIEYLVLKRTPAPGLPKRSSTDLRGF